MKVAFRVDADSARGGGHVYRCLALAEALVERPNVSCQFFTKQLSLETVPALARSAHDIVVLTDRCEREERQARTLGLGAGAVDVLVVDHRELGQSFELAARNWALVVAAIEDAPNRPHAVDLLIDHTHGRTANSYAEAAPRAQILAGSQFALLRGQFARCREESLELRENRVRLQRILVAFGATDEKNYSGAVLDMLLQFPNLYVDILLGASHPAMLAIRAKVVDAGKRATLSISREDVAQLMVDADLIVGAAGGMSWERCSLGIAAIVAIIAHDQREVAKSLVQAGAAICLGEGLESLAALPAAVAGLLDEPSRFRAMGQGAAQLCDGLGAQRAADMLLHLAHIKMMRRCG